MHVNPRHHSLVSLKVRRLVVHHLMMELYSLDDVGRGYDIAQGEPDRVKVRMGRHPNDYMTSFYMRSPSDLLIEYGWGGRDVDDATWQPEEMTSVGSLSGHQGLFESVGDAPPPDAPVMPPQQVHRAPLYVIDGNFRHGRAAFARGGTRWLAVPDRFPQRLTAPLSAENRALNQTDRKVLLCTTRSRVV